MTLLLAAVMLSVLGTGVSSALTFQRRSYPPANNGATARTGYTGRFSGEPDPNGSGGPCPPIVEKTSMLPSSPGLWLAQRWLQWRLQSLDPQGRRRH
jgi:hypothetical protein